MAATYDSGLSTSLLMHAAQSAAQADGLSPPEQNGGTGTRGGNVGGNNVGGGVRGVGGGMPGMDNLNQMNAMQQATLMQNANLQRANQMKPQMQTAPSGGGGGGGKKKGLPLRRGKWTPEEEAYANRLIQEFKAGLLPLTDGTTLRTFLSKLLNCDPMRISKKFVGSNCIGKQVFRRRTADLNRLTPEQIQKSRAELSELERRFLERVAQTNRVKSSGVGSAGAVPPPAELKKDDMSAVNPPSPPWLQPPLGYKQGQGAAMAAANLSGGESNSRAAAAGRALLQGLNPGQGVAKRNSGIQSQGSAGLLAMAELQRRASQTSMFQGMQGMGNPSAQNLFAGSQGSAMAQMARNASAARMGLPGNSMNNLMLKTGISRDQLSQLARERGLSSASLTNMMERKNSFDALMSLDFQSLQSIDNLANLIQTGGSAGNVPSSGMKNWSADTGRGGSSGSLSNAARRLASAGQMESLLRSLSNNNMRNGNPNNFGQNNEAEASSTNLQSLFQNMQNGASMSSLLGGAVNGSGGNNMASTASLANLLRENSSTGLTALRASDGLNQRNSSVEDFLSLVAAGDIPHQDPALLNVPLMQHQQQNNNQGGTGAGAGGVGGPGDAASMLAQQQLLAQATGNSALANALASRSFGNMRNNSGNGLSNSGSAAALFARAAAAGGGGNGGNGGNGAQGSGNDLNGSSLSLKRKLLDLGNFDQGGSNKMKKEDF